MNKCRHCGVFVPVEKAFCPNCSEPMEPEEAPNRAASSSSDMMATLRDDPDHYKELLALKKQLSTAQTETPPSDSPRAAASVTGYEASPLAPELMPSAKNRRNLVFIISAISILILLFALLLVLKVF
jgi:hypothetical protein